ncbi:MAG: CCC motif membrane protein [Chitinophagaceae bacterium]
MENPTPNPGQQYDSYAQMPLPNATAVLVLGIVSIFGCCCYGILGICGVIALVLYEKDRKLYAANPTAYTPGSYSNLKTGRICAIIGIVLSALSIISIIVSLIIFGTQVLTNPEEFLRRMQDR